MSEWPDSEMAYIAVCDEHGLHGERDTCFVCGRECQQVQMVTASWRGLLAHLDGMYPEAIFHGATGDPGDKIVVLARKLAQVVIAAQALLEEENHGLCRGNDWYRVVDELKSLVAPGQGSDGDA